MWTYGIQMWAKSASIHPTQAFQSIKAHSWYSVVHHKRFKIADSKLILISIKTQ